jgi:hypothetical protein
VRQATTGGAPWPDPRRRSTSCSTDRPTSTAGSGRFVQVETDDGHRIAIGAWTQSRDGCWSLRIDGVPIPRQPSTTDRPDEAATGDPTP